MSQREQEPGDRSKIVTINAPMQRASELLEFLNFQAEQWAWCFPGCLDYINRFPATERARWQCLERR